MVVGMIRVVTTTSITCAYPEIAVVGRGAGPFASICVTRLRRSSNCTFVIQVRSPKSSDTQSWRGTEADKSTKLASRIVRRCSSHCSRLLIGADKSANPRENASLNSAPEAWNPSKKKNIISSTAVKQLDILAERDFMIVR